GGRGWAGGRRRPLSADRRDTPRLVRRSLVRGPADGRDRVALVCRLHAAGGGTRLGDDDAGSVLDDAHHPDAGGAACATWPLSLLPASQLRDRGRRGRRAAARVRPLGPGGWLFPL